LTESGYRLRRTDRNSLAASGTSSYFRRRGRKCRH
jgi:hypothetical protein